VSRARSFLEQIALAGAARHRRRWLARDFSRTEARAFARRPDQSVAAALALKRAAMRLFAEICPEKAFAARSFRITHTRRGAPRLAAFPSLPGVPSRSLKRRLHVSASHTSTTAVGLVVYAGGDE